MASLYTHRSRNIRKTWILFSSFLIVVIGICFLFSQISGNSAILYGGIVFSLLMNVIAYWYSDKIVLSMAAARPATRENARELYNIVENLAITAGLPAPKIYIINERAPNAFATGRNPQHGVIAVTTGLLERLDRSELEGVLAHELSHIGNRDILLSTAAIVLVGFISITADIFLRSVLWGGGRKRNEKGGEAVILIGVVLSILAPLVARLMHLAISRKREFLADASGALLTRYPESLANALEKISADPTPLRAATNTTSHLYFDDPFTSKQSKTPLFHKLFMTHPPVEERIAALRGMEIQ